MKAEDVMMRMPKTCFTDDTAAEAARIMWDADCGAVPVIDRENRLVSMVTDRDLCMAAYLRGRKLSDIVVAEAASHGVISAKPTDDLSVVESLMERHQLRRIPIADDMRHVIGIITLNDLARRASTSESSVRTSDVMRALTAIGEPHRLREMSQ